MSIATFIGLVLSIGWAVLGAGAAIGQSYPNKTIRIVTAPAGGSADFVARLVAQEITGPLGQPVVIDNRPTTVIGAFGSKAPPDGYSLVLVGQSFWVSPFIENTSYDPINDFSAITLINRAPNILAVHPSLPVKSVKELIDLAKRRPGELNYAATGIASTSYLAAELFKSMAGLDIARINYGGGGPAVTAAISGEVQLEFLGASVLMPHVKSGRLKGLAVTSAAPSELAPGLPTVASSGLPGYVSELLQALLAPAKTPDAVINRLNQEITRALGKPEVKEQLLKQGSESAASSPSETSSAIKADMTRMGKLIKDLGVHP